MGPDRLGTRVHPARPERPLRPPPHRRADRGRPPAARDRGGVPDCPAHAARDCVRRCCSWPTPPAPSRAAATTRCAPCPASNDEVGVVVYAFNNMLDRIAERNAELSRANTELESEVEERRRVEAERTAALDARARRQPAEGRVPGDAVARAAHAAQRRARVDARAAGRARRAGHGGARAREHRAQRPGTGAADRGPPRGLAHRHGQAAYPGAAGGSRGHRRRGRRSRAAGGDGEADHARRDHHRRGRR